MPDSIETVEGKWERNKRLGNDLGSDRPGCKASRKDGGFQVPSHDWGNEVTKAEEIETTTQNGAGDTV